jgi:hypothetical protein
LTVLTPSETLSFVFAILGGSFRLLARAVLPLAPLFILAGCGGPSSAADTTGQIVRGPGYSFRAPAGWAVTRSERAVTARDGSALVSVTRFPLVKAYDPANFDAVAAELDDVAQRLAQQAGADLSKSETVQIAGRDVRAYSYDASRVAFVLEGKREYQLYCRNAADACDRLFESFAISGPQA